MKKKVLRERRKAEEVVAPVEVKVELKEEVKPRGRKKKEVK